jgi:hypothetical protein
VWSCSAASAGECGPPDTMQWLACSRDVQHRRTCHSILAQSLPSGAMLERTLRSSTPSIIRADGGNRNDMRCAAPMMPTAFHRLR